MAACRRLTVRFYGNVLAKVPKTRRAKAAAMLKAVRAMESREAAEVVMDSYAETLAYTRSPREHWRRIRANNAIERLNREIRRRTCVIWTFPDRKRALMRVTARLKCAAESEWGGRRYLDVTLLGE